MEYFVLMIFVMAGLAFFESFKRNRKKTFLLFDIGFLFTLFVLAFISAIRDDVGCDYYSYVRHIGIIQSGFENYMEPGFQFVVKQMAQYDRNPRYVIIFMGILTCFLYLKAIWDQSINRLFGVFLFLTWGLYFFTFNTIRNYFAIAIAFYAIKYLLSGKKIFFIDEKIVFIGLILLASSFHFSILFSLPLYIIAYYTELKKGHIPLIIAVIVILLLSQIPIRSFIFYFYASYEGSDFDTGRISYLNIFKALLIIGLCLKYKAIVYKDKYLRFYFNLNVFAFVLYIGVYWLPEISRIGFCLNMTVMFLIPRLVSSIKSSKERQELVMIIVIISLTLFVLLLNGFYAETNRTLPYKTWLLNGKFNYY